MAGRSRRLRLALCTLHLALAATAGTASAAVPARVTVLAEQPARSLPRPLAWVADASQPQGVTHRHELAFVYVTAGSTTVTIGSRTETATAGQALAVPATLEHTHNGGTIFEARLAPPGSAPLPRTTRLFASEPLTGTPPGDTNVRALEVVLPANGGETPVHTHPGSETILALTENVTYQRGAATPEILPRGAVRTLDASTTPVQKRNSSATDAAFLGLFVVDASKPFAPEASFEPLPGLPSTGGGGTATRVWPLACLGLSALLGLAATVARRRRAA